MAELGLDIVGGGYPMWRVDHYEWLAMVEQPDGKHITLPSNQRKGIVECDGLGAGCMMIKREILEKIVAPFADKIREDGTRAIGHDYFFCQKAKALGYKVWADWEILCDHVKLVPLITIVQALKKCYDEGYRRGLDESSKKAIIS
jgi:hypothetical protein